MIKKDGEVLSSMIHTPSEDGKTQTIKGTETKPDGTPLSLPAIQVLCVRATSMANPARTLELEDRPLAC